MTIGDVSMLDSAMVDERTGDAVLAIQDDLTWDDPEAHWDALGAKINAYLAFTHGSHVQSVLPGFDPESHSWIFLVVFDHDLPSDADRDRFAATVHALLPYGAKLVGQYQAADGSGWTFDPHDD